MDDPTTTATLDQADEDILTFTVSDDALEAAQRARRIGRYDYRSSPSNTLLFHAAADPRLRQPPTHRRITPHDR